MKTSKTVDAAIKRTYAALATAAAKQAVRAVEFDDLHKVDRFMAKVEAWLTRAGATATDWHYRAPQ